MVVLRFKLSLVPAAVEPSLTLNMQDFFVGSFKTCSRYYVPMFNVTISWPPDSRCCRGWKGCCPAFKRRTALGATPTWLGWRSGCCTGRWQQRSGAWARGQTDRHGWVSCPGFLMHCIVSGHHTSREHLSATISSVLILCGTHPLQRSLLEIE